MPSRGRERDGGAGRGGEWFERKREARQGGKSRDVRGVNGKFVGVPGSWGRTLRRDCARGMGGL